MEDMVKALSPEAQSLLIICLLLLGMMILMVGFLIVSDYRRTRNFIEGTEEITEAITHLRNRHSDEPPNASEHEL